MAQTYEMTSVEVPARAAALAWQNAFLAAGDEESRPTLFRTLSVEIFRTGVQFICTNGHILFRTWAPSDGAPWPEVYHTPERAVVIMDVEGFGKGFMSALLRITGEDGRAFEPLSLSIAPCDDSAVLALGDEFLSERVTLRACGQRIDLRTFEGEYPGWRHLRLDTIETERVDGMTVASKLLGLVGKLKGVTAVDLEFHGETRHVGFTARGDAEVRGLLMPMRRLQTRGEED